MASSLKTSAPRPSAQARVTHTPAVLKGFAGPRPTPPQPSPGPLQAGVRRAQPDSTRRRPGLLHGRHGRRSRRGRQHRSRLPAVAIGLGAAAVAIVHKGALAGIAAAATVEQAYAAVGAEIDGAVLQVQDRKSVV